MTDSIRLAALRGALLVGLAVTSTAHANSCEGAPRCVDSGAFATEVTQVSGSWDPRHRVYYVRVNFQVRNTTSQPLMLGFRWRSAASVVDNFGNTYGIDWKYKDRIVGIGIIGNDGADASFVLEPGASRSASLIFDRWPGNGSVGDAFNADFSVEQLEPIPGNNSVRSRGSYALSFPGLRAGQLTGAAAPPGGSQYKAAEVAHGIGNLINALKK